MTSWSRAAHRQYCPSTLIALCGTLIGQGLRPLRAAVGIPRLVGPVLARMPAVHNCCGAPRCAGEGRTHVRRWNSHASGFSDLHPVGLAV